ncbi:MAG: hypothetical protein PF637_05705 [Spirochaetes bacterium]|nr:hypothetical protein [Spirochaetota bacterium]
MENQYLKYIEFLEHTVASFYANTKNNQYMEKIRAVLEFMETHSETHAEIIASAITENTMPTLDPKQITDFQNSVLKDADQLIKSERDVLVILEKLAYSEEALGDFYKSIAGSMKELSLHYAKVSEIVSHIGDDEYNHRDILLQDRDRLKNR